MKKFVSDGLSIKGESICKITNKKCYTKELCKNCPVYINYKLKGKNESD
jgi:hypothetical protein